VLVYCVLNEIGAQRQYLAWRKRDGRQPVSAGQAQAEDESFKQSAQT